MEAKRAELEAEAGGEGKEGRRRGAVRGRITRSNIRKRQGEQKQKQKEAREAVRGKNRSRK